ncbi:MAG: hypothetical protein AAGK00_19370 [Pseudomonadota bacterium]
MKQLLEARSRYAQILSALSGAHQADTKLRTEIEATIAALDEKIAAQAR